MVDNLIKLFDSAATDFTTNGLGVLTDAETCIVTEEKNGAFELEMTYPITGKRYSDILMRRIIVAKSNPYSNPQPFRIYSITKPLNGIVTINAEHISYDMSGYPVPPFSATSCADALAKLKQVCPTECPFTFWTDKNVTKEYSTSKPYSMRSLLGGVDGSILSAFGKGEYEFDGYLVKLHLNRGLDRGVVIRYGKNLTDIKQEENCSSVYTGVYPYWYSENVDAGNMVLLPEGIVECEGSFDYQRIMMLDLSDKWTEAPTEEELRTAAQNYITDNKINEPEVSLDVSFEQLAQTKEYELYSLLEEVRLCDTVHVEFPKLGVSSKADCIATEYDVLTNKYKKIELGSSKTNLATTIANQGKELDETLSKTYLEQSVEQATKLISGNLGGYVIIRNSEGRKEPNEILIMDTPDIRTAQKVWRWNNNGLGYSKTGYNGPYGLAMTINGEINADFMTTGILNAISIRACDIKCGKIEETVVTKTRAAAQEKYAFELSGEGEIKATKGIIGLCEIDEDGRLIVPAAHITDLLTADQIDATELWVNAAHVKGELDGTLISAKNITLTSDDILNKFKYTIAPDAITLVRMYTQDGESKEETVLLANKDGITMTGTITAKTGNIGGFTIGSTAIYKGVTSLSDSENSGVYLGTDGIRLGLKDSFSVTDAGVIKATKGTIGGWSLAADKLSFSSTDSGGAGLYSGGSSTKASLVTANSQSVIRIWSGASYPTSGKFIVLEDGSMYAEAAKITGDITASAGKIGDWTIGTGVLYSGSTGLNTSSSYTKASLVTSGSNSRIAFYAGNDNRVDGKFIVLEDGSMYASAVNISGYINATAGQIGGFTVGGNFLYGPNSVIGQITDGATTNTVFGIGSWSISGNTMSFNATTSIIDNMVISGNGIFQNLIADSVSINSSFTANTLRLQKVLAPSDISSTTGFTFGFSGSSALYRATLSWSGEMLYLKIYNDAGVQTAIPESKTFTVNYACIWGGNTVWTATVSAGSSQTSKDTNAFWGIDYATFSSPSVNKSNHNNYFYLSASSSANNIGCCGHLLPTSDQTYVLGGGGNRWSDIYCINDSIKTSDENEKKDIEPLGNIYSDIFYKLKPISFKFKSNTSGRTHIGFLAQDVKKAILEVGLTTTDMAAYCEWINEDQTIGCGLRYTELIAMCVQEIQQLKRTISELVNKS